MSPGPDSAPGERPAERGRAMSRGERRWALAVSAALVVAAVVPGARLVAAGSDAPDGFPLSTYPMFVGDPGRVVRAPTVVGVTSDGRVDRLSPETIAGTDQVIQANEAVRRAVREGARSAAALCREVAGRVEGREYDTVAVVVERHDTIAWSAGDREPLDRRTVVECRVADA